MKSIQIDGQSAQLLKGNVQFDQEGSTVYCDQAEYNPISEQLKGNGNVRIVNTSGTIVTGKFLTYDNKTHEARVDGDVVLVDQSMTLKTPWLKYNTQSRLGWYGSGGAITDKNTNLKSRSGSFNPTTHTLFFKRDVVLQTPDYSIQTDTLQYNTESKTAYFFAYTQINTTDQMVVFQKGDYNTETKIGTFYHQVGYYAKDKTLFADTAWVNQNSKIGKARGNVWYIDSAEEMQFWAQAVNYEKEGVLSMAWGNPLAAQISKKDSFFVRADTFINRKDTVTKNQILWAINNSKFLKGTTSANANLMIYNSVDSTLKLRKNPVIWDSSTRMSGDSITFKIKNKKLNEGSLFPKAFLCIKEDSNAFSQIQGDSIHFNLDSNQRISESRVYRKGKSIYYLKEQDTLNSVFSVQCENMKFQFADGRISQVRFYVSPKGKLYPISEFPSGESKLNNFVWDEKNRPKTNDFTRPFVVKPAKIRYKSLQPKATAPEKSKKKNKLPLFSTDKRN